MFRRSSMECAILRDRVKAFAEGRVEHDPTVEGGVTDDERAELRAWAREHLERMENDRLARVYASRCRAGRAADGELVDGGCLVGSDEPMRRCSDSWPPRWI